MCSYMKNVFNILCTCDLRISRSLSMASEETSSLVKNNGFAATTCIANSDPTCWRASNEEIWSSARRDSTPAIRPKPEARSKVIVKAVSHIMFVQIP